MEVEFPNQAHSQIPFCPLASEGILPSLPMVLDDHKVPAHPRSFKQLPQTHLQMMQ